MVMDPYDEQMKTISGIGLYSFSPRNDKQTDLVVLQEFQNLDSRGNKEAYKTS